MFRKLQQTEILGQTQGNIQGNIQSIMLDSDNKRNHIIS